MAEGRRPVEGKVSSNACSGRSAGISMSQKQRASGSWRPNPRSRLTFDESPLRESCTVGSMGEVPGNWHLYPTRQLVYLSACPLGSADEASAAAGAKAIDQSDLP